MDRSEKKREVFHFPRVLRILFSVYFAQVFDTACRLIERTAFDAQDDVLREGFQNGGNFFPVDHAVTASTADGRPHDFTAFRIGLFVGNVLRVNVDDA